MLCDHEKRSMHSRKKDRTGAEMFVSNRLYRLLAFHPMASFSNQVFTRISCTVGLKYKFIIEFKLNNEQFHAEKMGTLPLRALV